MEKMKWFLIEHSNGWTIQDNENGCGEPIAQQYLNSPVKYGKILAAAPDLLEALELAKGKLIEEGFNEGGATISKIDNAIQKALK